MKLRELFGMMDDHGDVVSVYDTTPGNPYHTLYEGVVDKCPSKLLDRDALSFYPSFVREEPGVCIYLDGYDGLEEHDMALKLLDWHNDKTIPYRSDIQDEYDSIEFFEDGDDFLVYLNEDNGKYAVYYKLAHGGIVCSLIEHFDMYSRLVDTDDGLSKELYEVIARHAIDCGFPETHPPINVGVTWRQLIAKLNEFPKEFLDTPAYVCMDNDGNLECVADVQAWYVDEKPVDDNCLYIDLVRNKDEE